MMMTLENARTQLEQLISHSTNSTERKLYAEFYPILYSLSLQKLSEIETQNIGKELEIVFQQSNAKEFRNAINQFKYFLKNIYSFTPKGYFTRIAVSIGTFVGLFVGVLFLSHLERSMGISYGIMAGMFMGLVIGRVLDTRSERAGNQL